MKKKKQEVPPKDGGLEASNVEQLRGEVEDTSNIMQDNLHKIVVRGARLEDLETRTQNLEDGAKVFQKTCRKVQKKQRWRRKKWILVGIGAVSLALCVIILAVILSLKPWQSDQ